MPQRTLTALYSLSVINTGFNLKCYVGLKMNNLSYEKSCRIKIFKTSCKLIKNCLLYRTESTSVSNTRVICKLLATICFANLCIGYLSTPGAGFFFLKYFLNFSTVQRADKKD